MPLGKRVSEELEEESIHVSAVFAPQVEYLKAALNVAVKAHSNVSQEVPLGAVLFVPEAAPDALLKVFGIKAAAEAAPNKQVVQDL